MNDPGKQPRGIAFFGNRLFYSDSAFDKIQVAEIITDGQLPEFSDFKKDITQVINLRIFLPQAG